MANEYICKQDAIIEMMDNDVDHAQGMDGREVVQILSDIPAADVVPVVHGEWLNGIFDSKHYRCSICNYHISNLVRENYCPNCGAKMDEEE